MCILDITFEADRKKKDGSTVDSVMAFIGIKKAYGAEIEYMNEFNMNCR